MHAKFYALLAQLPGATKEDIVSQYEPSGSLSALLKQNKRLYAKMLNDMVSLAKGCSESEAIEGDLWRKRVIRVIAKHFENEGRYRDITAAARMLHIKGMATRIAKTERFNDIPIVKLRSIYNTFRSK